MLNHATILEPCFCFSFVFHILLSLRNEVAWALREPAYVRWALSPLGHREPRKWTLQHYMGSQHSQAARPQTLKCLLPFWLTSASPKICTYKAHSFPFAQLSHNNWGWRQGKTSGKGLPTTAGPGMNAATETITAKGHPPSLGFAAVMVDFMCQLG